MAETINFEELAKQDVPGWGAPPAPAAAPPTPAAAPPQGIDFESLAAQDVPGWKSRPAPAEAPPGGLQSLTLKPGVDVARLAPEAHPVFADLDSYLAGQGIKGGVVTSGYQHRAQPSLHSHGRAVDIVFSGQNMPQIAQQLQQQGFSTHYERKGQVNSNGSVATGDHIHFNLYPRTRPRTVGELRQAESQSVTHEYPTTPGAPPPTQPARQPAPAPNLAPTIAFRTPPAERASAEAEAAWASAPPIARDPRHPVAETGPIRDLLDRRVAAVRAVLQDPQIGLEMQHRAALLGTQYKELAKREVLYKKGQLSDDGVRQFVHDVAQYQANTTALEQRRQQILHYGRLGQQLGEHGYQLPQGQYREETLPAKPSTLAAFGQRLWKALPAPVRTAGHFVASMSGAVTGVEEAEKYRKSEYGRPDLLLPPLTGHTPEERRAQIDAKNNLLHAIRGAASELVGGRAMSPENVRAGVVKRLGRTLTPWEQRLYPTLFKIAGVEARAGAQEATGAATDITMLAAGGPLAHAGAGLAEKAIGGTVARGLERGGAVALAARAGRYLVPKAAAGVAAGGGLGAPLAAGQAVAAGATPKETLAAAGRGFALGSALGVLTEVGLGALGAGLGKAGEKVGLGQVRLRAGAAAKAQAANHGLTPAEVPALRERIVEVTTAPHEQQMSLAMRLKDDLDTRSPEQPLVAPAKSIKGRLKLTTVPPPTTPEHPVTALQRATPEEVVRRGSLAEDPTEQARHADWTERQQRRTQQYDFGRRPLPIDTAEQYANEWQTPKNPAYRDYTNLRSRARQVATDDPALAQKLTEAADKVRENWTYAFRDQHFRQQGFAEEFLSPVPREVPTDLSPWRELAPEERAKLAPAERDALLRQDVTHSLQTLDPDHVPRTEVPKVAAKNLENYADQLHQQAQARVAQLSDEAAARGPAAPPPAPPAETAPPVPPVPAEVAPAERAVGPAPGEVTAPAKEQPALPPARPPTKEQPTLQPGMRLRDPKTGRVLELVRRIVHDEKHPLGVDWQVRGRPEDLWAMTVLERDLKEDYQVVHAPSPEGTGTPKQRFLAELKTQGRGSEAHDTPTYHKNAYNLLTGKTGKSVDLVGFRQESAGGRIPGTGTFWGVDPSVSGTYALRGAGKLEDIPQGGPIANLSVESLSFKNPLYVEGGHQEFVRGVADYGFSSDHQKAIKVAWKQIATRGEKGYALLDKAIARAARDAGYDSVIYRKDIDGVTPVADGTSSPRDRTQGGEVGTATEIQDLRGIATSIETAKAATEKIAPTAKDLVHEQAARVEQEYRKQGYSPVVTKSQGEAIVAQARADTPKARAIRGDTPTETATSGGGGGVGVPPPAGQGPAAELPKIPKGMRPGRTIIRPRPEGAFPEHAAGPKEWQFEGAREKSFRENFGPAPRDVLDAFRDTRKTLRSVEDFTAPGQRTNIAHKLPKTPFFANVRQKLMSISTGMGKASDDAMNRMFTAYGKLEPKALMLLNRVAFIRDMWEDVQTQIAQGVTRDGVKLPEPWTIQDAHNELIRINLAAEGHVGITKALNARKAMWDQVIDEYSNTYEAVTGRRPNLSRRDYFRHEVFFYQMGKAGLRGGPEGLGKPFKPSFLMQRRGTVLPYKTNLLDADHGVLASMLHHTQIFKAWKEVMGFDIRHQLETQSALWRMGHTTADDPQQLDNLLKLSKLSDDLPDTHDGQFASFLSDIQRLTTAPSTVDAETLGRDAVHYVKWLRSRAGGVPSNIANKLPFGGVTAREAFQRNAAGKDTITYRDLIPDGYREIKGVGNVLQTAYNMTNGTIDEILNQHQRGVLALPAGEGAPALPASTATPLGPKPTGTLPGEVRMGKLAERAPRNDSIIVPKELARVLEGMHKQTLTGWNAIASTAWRRFNSGWKNWELMSPFTAAGYFTRKLSGELEAVAVVNPRLFASKHPLQATKELYGFLFKGAQPSENLEDAMRRGLFSGIFVNEGGKSSRSELQRFTQFTSQGTYPLEAPAKLAKAGVLGIRRAHELQEGILRYAQYTDALEQLEKTGKLRNYGASVPEELEALHDPKDKAWKYSNDLLGAYDEISVAGQWLRQNLVPFWSFKEVNAKRWYQIQRNAWDDPALAAIAGRRVLGFLGGRATDTALTVGAAKAASLGAFYLKATALSASLDWYNRRFHMEEEMSLSPQIRAIPHIILGRGPDGRVNYISRLGTIWEVTSHFGLQNPGGIATMWANGKSMKEIFDTVRGWGHDPKKTAQEMVMEGPASLAHSVVGLLAKEGAEMGGPVKDAAEFVMKQRFDPEKLRFTPNNDPVQHILDSVRLGGVYDWFKTDKARRPGFGQGLAGVKTSGYHEGAYSESRMWASEFARHFDPKEYTSYSADDPKTVALYQAVQAKKWGDTRAWKTNLLNYVFSGGTQKSFDGHITKLSPLGPLPVPEKMLLRQKFLESLSDDEWKNLVRGYDYWASTWTNTVNVYDKKSYEQPKTKEDRASWTVSVEAAVRSEVASSQEINRVAQEGDNAMVAPYLKQKKVEARTGIPPTTPEPKR